MNVKKGDEISAYDRSSNKWVWIIFKLPIYSGVWLVHSPETGLGIAITIEGVWFVVRLLVNRKN